MKYQWIVLQDGHLPLKLNGSISSEEHVCTATLIWPLDDQPNVSNSLVVDPCFSHRGFVDAEQRLQQTGASIHEIGYFFETHRHYDHTLQFPSSKSATRQNDSGAVTPVTWSRLSNDSDCLPGIAVIPCPGHSPDLQIVQFSDAEGVVCVASDAILNREWLMSWQYYWPNGYGEFEIVQTWRSLGEILSSADVVIPGHGPPFRIDAALLRQLIDRFPRAAHSRLCPEVSRSLTDRLHRLSL